MSGGTTARSLREALRAAGQALSDAGIIEPRLEARDLLLHVTGRDRSALAHALEEPLSRRHDEAFRRSMALRLAGTPLDRIMGKREFMGRSFGINAETLSPREDTAAVIELARTFLDSRQRMRLLDLGTGSGILLITLLAEFPLSSGVGVDLAQGALDMAAANAARLGVGGRATFTRSDWFEAIEGDFDLVVANPPYIETAIVPGLEREVRDHDPHLALDGGADGLAAYRRIASGASAVLAASGVVLVEIGRGQGAAVCAIFAAQGLACAKAKADLAGIERALAFKLA